jgi:hypothetical protein
MQVAISERWTDQDKSIYFVHNFTDVREAMDVSINGLPIDTPKYLNDTIGFTVKDWEFGNNILYNETEVREFHFIVNGKQPVEGKWTDRRSLKAVAHRCVHNCFDEPVEEALCNMDTIKKWSELKTWEADEDPETKKKRRAFHLRED